MHDLLFYVVFASSYFSSTVGIALFSFYQITEEDFRKNKNWGFLKR